MARQRSLGVIVAPEHERVRVGAKEMKFDSDVNQFKYAQVIVVKRTMPQTTAGNSSSIDVQIPHGLSYLPSFKSFMKGYGGEWGTIMRGAQSPLSYDLWPYSGTESVDTLNYNLTLICSPQSIAVGSHIVTIKVILLYDEVQA